MPSLTHATKSRYQIENSAKQMHQKDIEIIHPAEPQPAVQVVRREPLPEEGLVDLDPAEGQRRGEELMTLLRRRTDCQPNQC